MCCEFKYRHCQITEARVWGKRNPGSPLSTEWLQGSCLSNPEAIDKGRPEPVHKGLTQNILISEGALTWPGEGWGLGEKKETAFIFWRILQHFPILGLEVLALFQFG